MVERLQTQSLMIDYVEAWQGSNVGLSKARVKEKARNLLAPMMRSIYQRLNKRTRVDVAYKVRCLPALTSLRIGLAFLRGC